jgi:hypothetical protein
VDLDGPNVLVTRKDLVKISGISKEAVIRALKNVRPDQGYGNGIGAGNIIGPAASTSEPTPPSRRCIKNTITTGDRLQGYSPCWSGGHTSGRLFADRGLADVAGTLSNPFAPALVQSQYEYGAIPFKCPAVLRRPNPN